MGENSAFKTHFAWATVVWHKGIIPKHAINMWLFTLNRKPTMERLLSWGMDIEPTCLLCGIYEETRNHLFFRCSYSQPIWADITLRLQLPGAPTDWDEILLWLHTATSNKSKSLALILAWQAIVYEVWKERNKRYHDGMTLPNTYLTQKIIHNLKNKSLALKNMGSKHGEVLILFWSS